MFLPTVISLTPRFRRECKVLLHSLAENAEYDPKKHNCEDNFKFHSAFFGNNDQLCYALLAKTGSD
jgi:hypothetical protein